MHTFQLTPSRKEKQRLIAGRILEIVIPQGQLTQQQLKALEEAYKYTQRNNVTIIITQTR
jgi:hypothetical protein